MFPDNRTIDTTKFYVTDSNGIKICSGPVVRLDSSDGQEQQLPWTLDTYIRLSSFKYPSKLRLYVVGPDPTEGKCVFLMNWFIGSSTKTFHTYKCK